MLKLCSWIGFRILDCLKANCREQNNAKENDEDARRQRKRHRGRRNLLNLEAAELVKPSGR